MLSFIYISPASHDYCEASSVLTMFFHPLVVHVESLGLLKKVICWTATSHDEDMELWLGTLDQFTLVHSYYMFLKSILQLGLSPGFISYLVIYIHPICYFICSFIHSSNKCWVPTMCLAQHWTKWNFLFGSLLNLLSNVKG